MPKFKTIHRHIRHTHEDEVEAEKHQREGTTKSKDDSSAVMKEVELYNKPFEPQAPTKPAHYVAV